MTTLTLRGTRLGSALPEKALLYQLAVSAAALGLASLVAGEPWPAQLTGASLWPLAFQTVVITFASYLVWFWLVRHYPATRISAFTLLTPVFGLLAGVVDQGAGRIDFHESPYFRAIGQTPDNAFGQRRPTDVAHANE